ncbi:MAG: TM0106 family RecB-like putative nuclease [Desulfobacteraceae bacterium]|nr:TM0106 family RecB-like putative nuclease [Desulfobacteraceae bacterium]
MLRLRASDFYTYFRPSKCEVRIYLKSIGMEEGPPGPFDEILFRLGERHEKAHLATFPEYANLREGKIEDRVIKTRHEIQKGTPVLYQAVLRSEYKLGGIECEIVGEPDFLVRQENDYIICDSKLSRRINEKDHPEILRQLEIYGWLYEQTFGKPPMALHVHSGTGDIVEVPYDGGLTALQYLEEILALKLSKSEPYSPVGWSKCGGCPFHGYCWPRAEKAKDVALVHGVDQGLATVLVDQGVNTINNLLNQFQEDSLAELKRPWGKGMRKVGKSAASILLMAKAMLENKEFLIQRPSIPEHPNYVMFDLEGLPPQLDNLEKIYIWGMQVYGEEPSEFMPAIAGFGEDGDREGWDIFLENAKNVFDRFADIPFIHWHHYERVKIDLYRERYGDRDGIAERVRGNLLDILPITQRSIALPLPSYSLKVVEKYVGFKRTLDDVAGDWAMAKYIEAIETEDPAKRDEVMNEILTYNQEDLEATWAVLNWLKSKCE